jgi:hypothetical protein
MTHEEETKNDAIDTRILDQARLRPQPAGRRRLNGKVINALIKLKSSGLFDNAVKHAHND